jgi:hypothetical protein
MTTCPLFGCKSGTCPAWHWWDGWYWGGWVYVLTWIAVGLVAAGILVFR